MTRKFWLCCSLFVYQFSCVNADTLVNGHKSQLRRTSVDIVRSGEPPQSPPPPPQSPPPALSPAFASILAAARVSQHCAREWHTFNHVTLPNRLRNQPLPLPLACMLSDAHSASDSTVGIHSSPKELTRTSHAVPAHAHTHTHAHTTCVSIAPIVWMPCDALIRNRFIVVVPHHALRVRTHHLLCGVRVVTQ